MKKMTSHDESGFTLVELLVVMSIISALAAIAIPVFMSQQSKGYKAQMEADLHAATVAELAFSANNGGAYTADLTALATEGFRSTSGITTHAKVIGTDYVACSSSASVATWLTYSSATGDMTSSVSDCA